MYKQCSIYQQTLEILGSIRGGVQSRMMGEGFPRDLMQLTQSFTREQTEIRGQVEEAFNPWLDRERMILYSNFTMSPTNGNHYTVNIKKWLTLTQLIKISNPIHLLGPTKLALSRESELIQSMLQWVVPILALKTMATVWDIRFSF